MRSVLILLPFEKALLINVRHLTKHGEKKVGIRAASVLKYLQIKAGGHKIWLVGIVIMNWSSIIKRWIFQSCITVRVAINGMKCVRKKREWTGLCRSECLNWKAVHSFKLQSEHLSIRLEIPKSKISKGQMVRSVWPFTLVGLIVTSVSDFSKR